MLRAVAPSSAQYHDMIRPLLLLLLLLLSIKDEKMEKEKRLTRMKKEAVIWHDPARSRVCHVVDYINDKDRQMERRK